MSVNVFGVSLQLRCSLRARLFLEVCSADWKSINTALSVFILSVFLFNIRNKFIFPFLELRLAKHFPMLPELADSLMATEYSMNTRNEPTDSKRETKIEEKKKITSMKC